MRRNVLLPTPFWPNRKALAAEDADARAELVEVALEQQVAPGRLVQLGVAVLAGDAQQPGQVGRREGRVLRFGLGRGEHPRAS
jgi:hypothetical protein